MLGLLTQLTLYHKKAVFRCSLILSPQLKTFTGKFLPVQVKSLLATDSVLDSCMV